MRSSSAPDFEDPLSRGNILIVDDILENLQVLAAMLEEDGYDVRQSLSGETALMGIAAEAPDLILLDIMMPGLNGYEVCQHLKSQPAFAEIPIIFISALDDLQDKLRGFEVGGADYIVKPFQAQEVKARVEHQLTIQTLQRQLKKANQKLVDMNGLLEERVRERTAQLRYHILFDELTGLPSRSNLLNSLDQALTPLQSPPAPGFALLLIDCDRFSLINSSLGYGLGDQLLILVGERLSAFVAQLDPSGVVSRFGEDDFCLLIYGIQSSHQAEAFAEKVFDVFKLPFQVDLYLVYLSVSIGVVLGDTSYGTPQELLRDADTALHQAKVQGRGSLQVFDPILHLAVTQRLQLETDLRQAWENQVFHVFYQPIVNLKTGRIFGFEALIRWQHPERGAISPVDFIPCMEETGLIIPVGMEILRLACQQLQHWQQAANRTEDSADFDLQPLVMSVNLSTRQFSYPSLLQDIDQILTDYNLAPTCLKLEITESVIIDNVKSAQALIEQLRARQINVTIDDFGTGYSSLSYLDQFPLDSLKIDRSFVKGIGPQGQNAEITTAVIALSRALGLSVIAEGIESDFQVQVLRQLGCDYGQGYYFGCPLSAEEAWQLLRQDPLW